MKNSYGRTLAPALAGLICLLVFSAAALCADAVSVREPWARATVPGQKVAGAYMEIISVGDARLVGVSSAAAGAAELHSMKMENGTMKMRAIESLDLPAGKPVKLAPGGYHVMLFDLKRPLLAGEKVALVLTVEDAGKRRHQVPVTAIVRDRDEESSGHHDHH